MTDDADISAYDNDMDLALAHMAADGEGHRLSVINPR